MILRTGRRAVVRQAPAIAARLLIVADCKVDPVFVGTLEETLGMPADVLSIDTTGRARARSMYRHLSYLVLAAKAIARQRVYQHIVFWQQFAGLYYSLLSPLLPARKRGGRTIVLHLIYKRRRGLPGRLYSFLFRAFLRSHRIDEFICHSSRERQSYVRQFGADLDERIRFVGYGAGTPSAGGCIGGQAGWYFAGGTSNRDYATLIGAFRDREESLTVSCFPRDVEGIDIPPNVRVLHDVYGDDFLDLMRGACAVIVALDNPAISSGHLVLLDAMRLGKATIATKGECTEDIVDESCSLLVGPHSAGELTTAIDALTLDPEKRVALGRNGRLKYESRFTVRKYAERIAGRLSADGRCDD